MQIYSSYPNHNQLLSSWPSSSIFSFFMHIFGWSIHSKAVYLIQMIPNFNRFSSMLTINQHSTTPYSNSMTFRPQRFSPLRISVVPSPSLRHPSATFRLDMFKDIGRVACWLMPAFSFFDFKLFFHVSSPNASSSCSFDTGKLDTHETAAVLPRIKIRS